MTVTMCDRCKKTYKALTILSARITLTKMLPSDMQYRENPVIFDLCPDCVSDFHAFIANKNEKENSQQ
jgi:hypothetical protein